MRLRTVRRTMIILALVAVGAARQADAAIITAVIGVSLPGSSAGSVGPIATVAPNNDPTFFPSPNVVPFSISFNDGGVGPADFVFTIQPSGGTTEYLFLGTALVNNTGQAWTDYHFELGTGTGAAFIPWTAALGELDFDLPDAGPAPTSSVFPVLNHQPLTLDWSGATVYPLGSGLTPVAVQFSFSIDLPDRMAPFFTLRQYPTVPTAVPEPVSGLLLATGLTIAAAARLRGQRR